MQNAKYALLKAMEIMPWISNNAPLKSDSPIFCAPCLVILKAPPQQEEKKLLEKMLDVLQSTLCVAWVNSTNQAEILNTIQQWAPKTLLVLGRGLEFLQNLPHAYHTHDPRALLQSPHLKRETYNVLLELKATL